MISISAAFRFIDKNVSVLSTERVSLEDSVGRVLAAKIIADTDLPPFDRSQMDGYAVIASDTKKTPTDLKIVGESAAGHGWHKKVNRGEAIRIMTGAPVPAGADAVQKLELTKELDSSVTIFEPIKKGTAIVRKGAEIKRGRTVLEARIRVTSNNIAVLAAFGYEKVKVAKRPRVGILGTGSEIVKVSKKPGRDQIRNSNSIMLKAMVEAAGGVARVFENVGDDIAALKKQISKAVKNNDILIITGGVSVGKYDLTKKALLELGAEIFFEKLNLKPGKPTVFARLGKTIVFGLPGNPVSAAVTFYLFTRKAILQMQNAKATGLTRSVAILARDAKAARDRDTFLPAITSSDKQGRLTATSLKSQGSSDLVGFAKADSLIFISAGKSYNKGDQVEVSFL